MDYRDSLAAHSLCRHLQLQLQRQLQSGEAPKLKRYTGLSNASTRSGLSGISENMATEYKEYGTNSDTARGKGKGFCIVPDNAE